MDKELLQLLDLEGEELELKILELKENGLLGQQQWLELERKLKQHTKNEIRLRGNEIRLRDAVIYARKKALDEWSKLPKGKQKEFANKITSLREDIPYLESEQLRMESEQGDRQNELSLREPVASALETLEKFDFESLPADVRDIYISRLLGYWGLHNNHYVVEAFVEIVNAGFNPPKWIILAITEGFQQYLQDPMRDPKQLGKKLKLEGATRGATNPWRERKLRVKRTPAMLDMSTLIIQYGLSQDRAAKAVKIKYTLKESASTLKKYFSSYWGGGKESFTNPRYSTTLSDYERTRFGSSFPVKARKLFNK